jgi:hypothetical protein
MMIPPVPHFENVEGGWETFGVATVYPVRTNNPRSTSILLWAGMSEASPAV